MGDFGGWADTEGAIVDTRNVFNWCGIQDTPAVNDDASLRGRLIVGG